MDNQQSPSQLYASNHCKACNEAGYPFPHIHFELQKAWEEGNKSRIANSNKVIDGLMRDWPWPGDECGLSKQEWLMEQVVDTIRMKTTTLEAMSTLGAFADYSAVAPASTSEWQLCPKCSGTGKLQPPYEIGHTGEMIIMCNMCNRMGKIERPQPAAASVPVGEGDQDKLHMLMGLVRYGWSCATTEILEYCNDNKVSPQFTDKILEMLDENKKQKFVYEIFKKHVPAPSQPLSPNLADQLSKLNPWTKDPADDIERQIWDSCVTALKGIEGKCVPVDIAQRLEKMNPYNAGEKEGDVYRYEGFQRCSALVGNIIDGKLAATLRQILEETGKEGNT